MNLAQYIGAALALIGTLLIASDDRKTQRLAFMIYAVSNVILIDVFVEANMWPLVGLQSLFLLTSIRGIWKKRPC